MPATTLSEALARYGHEAYLLTVGTGGPHTSHVSVMLRDQGQVVACAVSRSAARNIAEAPLVSLFWPPDEPGGYAIILNGTATAQPRPDGVTFAEIALTKSVFHRRGPKPADSDGPCASDCKQIRRS